MPRKPRDLRKRLNSLRAVPPAPIAVFLTLEPHLLKALTERAAQEGQTVESYLQQILRAHLES